MVKRIISILLAGVCTIALLAGCQNVDSANENSSKEVKNTTGKITMSGSTSMEKFCSILNEAMMLEYPGIQASTEYTGSSAGIEAVTAKTVDIGNSSRNLKDEEKEAGIVENIVAIDGIAVVTHKGSKVKDLTKEQLVSIYNRSVTNWKDLGGEDIPIVVIGREAGSGTRAAFEELLKLEDKCKYVQEVDSTGGVMAKVAATKGAIGYVSLDVINDTVTVMSLNGVKANEDNIKSGDYLLSRPFVMATNGEISEQSEAVQALFQFIDSDKGKEIIRKAGLVPAK